MHKDINKKGFGIFILIKVIILSVLSFQPASANAKPSKHTGVAENIADVKGADLTLRDLFEKYKDSQPEKAAEYATLFLNKVDTADTHRSIGDMASFLQNYLENDRHQYSEAIQYSGMAIRIYLKTDDKISLAKQYLSNARLHIRLEQLDSALQSLYNARAIMDDGQYINWAEYYKLNGVIFQKAGDPQLSSKYLRQSTEMASKTGNDEIISSISNEGTLSFKTEKEKRHSIKLLKESLDQAIQNKDTTVICTLYLNLAGALSMTGDSDEAKRYCDMAEKYARDDNDKGHLHMVRASIGISMKDTPTAINELEKALLFYNAENFPGYRLNILDNLASSLVESGDTLKAFRYLWEYKTLSDKIGYRSIIPNLYATHSRFEREQQEKTAQESANKKIWLYLVMAVIIMAFVITGMYVYFKHIIGKRVEEQLEKRVNDSKTSMQLRCMRCSKIIKDANTKLEEFINLNRNIRHLDELSEINLTLSEVQKDTSVNELDHYVADFDSEMYRGLIKDHPNLSPNESRLCVLLVKNMSTKQISDITRQSPEAIKMARTRLRNKLGLTGKKMSIQEYLNKYKS